MSPPCERWQEWERTASQCRSKDNLIHSIPIDTQTKQHMTVEKTIVEPLPPVLQQYPLPKIEKSSKGNHLLDCDSEDDNEDDDDDLLDQFTLLAILESQRESQAVKKMNPSSSITNTNKAIPTVVHVSQKETEMFRIEKDGKMSNGAVTIISPIHMRDGLLKHENKRDTIDDDTRRILLESFRNHHGEPGIHPEGFL